MGRLEGKRACRTAAGQGIGRATAEAFAPGALDALIILAHDMDVDPAYVAAHHLARFLALVAAVPLLARWLHRHP